MSKQTHSDSIHMTDEVFALVVERSKAHPSKNAYFLHCIEVERRAGEGRCECNDAKLAAAVRSVFSIIGDSSGKG